MIGTITVVVAVLVGSAAGGAVGYLLGRRGAAGSGGPRPGALEPEVRDYLASVAELGETLPTVWSGHVESSRVQMESAVGELTSTFGQIVILLDEALSTSRNAVGGGHGHVFDASRQRLNEVVEALDNTLSQRERTLKELGLLVDLNDQMKSMTDQVTRIASQTHLLALNAAIEARRVGDAGQAFGVVAMEVRQLADLSGSTGKQIGDLAEQVGQAISGALALATENAEVESTLVLDANAKVQSVLEDLMALVGGLSESSDDLGRTASGIKDQIAESLVQFQFQDRIGQTLTHVRDSIDGLPAVLAQARVDSPDELHAIDSAALLQQLASTYTMVEEHHVHGTGDTISGPAGLQNPAGEADSDITFF